MTAKRITKPRRSTPDGYARGAETRRRIVEAALDIFGAIGFEEASTRQIAGRAGVNLAALHYYFSGKQGLYRACAEHIAEYGEGIVGPFVSRIESELKDPRTSRGQLRALLHQTLDAFADRLVSPQEPPSWVAFVLREQMNPSTVYAVLHKRVAARVIGTMAALVGRLVDLPAEHPETIVRTFAILGLLMVFQRARGAALLALGWKDISGERLALVKTVLWDQSVGTLGLRTSGPNVRGRARGP